MAQYTKAFLDQVRTKLKLEKFQASKYLLELILLQHLYDSRDKIKSGLRLMS